MCCARIGLVLKLQFFKMFSFMSQSDISPWEQKLYPRCFRYSDRLTFGRLDV